MSFPVYLRLGSVSVHPHWVFDVLAYTAGIWLLTRRRRRMDDVVDTSHESCDCRDRGRSFVRCARRRGRVFVGRTGRRRAQAARQQDISTRVSKIGVGSVVKIERKDGRKIEGVLTAKTPAS